MIHNKERLDTGVSNITTRYLQPENLDQNLFQFSEVEGIKSSKYLVTIRCIKVLSPVIMEYGRQELSFYIKSDFTILCHGIPKLTIFFGKPIDLH